MQRARGLFAAFAVLLSVLTTASETPHAPLLVGVALAAALLLAALVQAALPITITGIAVEPRRARAPGVILAGTHPATAGHPKPRAPGRLAVARA